MVMKQAQARDHQQQQPLSCPRCDSSNTKFCYYNNYSLSQPRHFCKACKRYWTRGGTLRSIPVGGGCRKNKRSKRPNSASDPTPTPPSIKSSNPITNMNPVFYGLQPNNQPNVNLTLPRSYDTDLSPFNDFRRDFSSTQDQRPHIDPTIQLHDFMTYTNIQDFPGFAPSSTTSLIASGLQSLKETKATNCFQAMLPLGCRTTEAKLEEGNDLINKVNFRASCIDPFGSFDSSVYWNSATAWPDLSNYGSSPTSLI